MTLDRHDVACRWIPALSKQVGCTFRHIVIDQGSTDGTADALTLAGNLEIVRVGTNLGVAGGWELGYRHAIATGPRPDIVCRVDDDCEALTDDVLAQTVDFLTLTDYRYIASPLNVTLTEHSGYFPQTTDPDTTTIAGYNVKVVSHTGLFVAAPATAFRRMLDTGAIRRGDMARGRYWTSIGYPSVYLTDLHVAHHGRGLRAHHNYRY